MPERVDRTYVPASVVGVQTDYGRRFHIFTSLSTTS